MPSIGMRVSTFLKLRTDRIYSDIGKKNSSGVYLALSIYHFGRSFSICGTCSQPSDISRTVIFVSRDSFSSALQLKLGFITSKQTEAALLPRPLLTRARKSCLSMMRTTVKEMPRKWRKKRLKHGGSTLNLRVLVQNRVAKLHRCW